MRSFGHRPKWAVILGLLTGAGAVLMMFVVAWTLTRINVVLADRSASPMSRPEAVDLGTFPWTVGAFVGFVTFLKELLD